MADLNRTVGIVFTAESGAASASAQGLSEALSGVAAAASTAAPRFDNLGTAQGRLLESMRGLQIQTASAQIATARLTGDADLLARGQRLLATSFEFTGTKAEMLLLQQGRLTAQNDLAAAKARQLGDAVDGQGRSFSGASAGADMFSRALSAISVALIFRAFVDANVELEKFTRSMTATTGSAGEAAVAYEYVRGVANRLGIETGATANSFALFAAATKGTTLEGEGARRVFEAFAGTMSRLGSSSSDINLAFVQLAQGISKGKFELEDLKNIAERLPGFFDQFARSLSVTTPELFKMISAGQIGAVEIAKFAEALNKGLDGAKFEGYVNSLARLKNAIDDAFRVAGEAGAFPLLTAAVEKLGVAVGATSGSFVAIGSSYQAFKTFLSTGDYERLKKDLGDVKQKVLDTAEALYPVDPRPPPFSDIRFVALQESIERIAPAFSDARFEVQRLAGEAKETDKALRVLGLDPKKFDKDVYEIREAFKRLASDPAVSGDTILAGLKKTLEQLKTGDQVREVIGQLSEAFTDGRLSANQYADQVNLAKNRILELSDGFTGSTKTAKAQEEQLKKNEAATKKAEEETRKYALELEKLASNERIKNIEARVTIKVAELESQTKRVQAAFESITATVTDTGKSIGDLFGLFKDSNLSFSQLALIREQIDKENVRRDNALKLQGDLTRAQIDKMKAETDAISKGDALIKIDGAGLQPHLEAFMWEILRTIQTRVNQDGLKLLLGS